MTAPPPHPVPAAPAPPTITGGEERLRTFASRLFAFRASHRALRPAYSAAATIALPKPPEGKTWATSSAAEAWANFHEAGAEAPVGAAYAVDRRTVAIFVAR